MACSGEHHVGAVGEVLLCARASRGRPCSSPVDPSGWSGGFEAGRLEDAHRLDHHRRADAVVGGARARVPRVEVGADHHDLVGLVAARQFGDHVDRVEVGVDEAVLDVDLERHRDLLVEEAQQAAVVLAGGDDLRQHRRVLRLPLAFTFGRRLDAHGAVVAAIAGRHLDERQRAFLDQERHALLAEVGGRGPGTTPARPAAEAAAARRIHRRLGQVGQRLFRGAVSGWRRRTAPHARATPARSCPSACPSTSRAPRPCR